MMTAMSVLRTMCALISHQGPGKHIVMEGDFAIIICDRCDTIEVDVLQGEHTNAEIEAVLEQWIRD